MSSKKITYVYIAGSLTPRGAKSTNPAIEYLLNIRDLVRHTLDTLFAGFTPFCPAIDFVYFLSLKEGERITEPVIKRISKDWLRRCDAILMTPGWKGSPGSIAEKELAEELKLPVFYSIEEMLNYNVEAEQPQLPLTN